MCTQSHRPLDPFFFIIVTFKDFFSSDDKGNMYLMQKKVPKGLAVSVGS